jgi:hypothetical protein
MLLALLGCCAHRRTARRVFAALAALALVVIAAGWRMAARGADARWLTAFPRARLMLVVAMRSAARGDRLGLADRGGMALLLVSLAGLSWIALDRSAPGRCMR